MVNVKLQKINSSGTATITYTTPTYTSLTIDLNTPVSPMPLPEEDDDENILVKIEGNSSVINFGWMMTPTNGSTSGTNVPTVSNVFQQVLFFMNIFQPKSIEDKYRFLIDDASDPIQKDGFYTKFTFRMSGNDPINFSASCQFISGDVITVYNLDAPGKPTGVSASTGGSSGEIDVTWTAPTNPGGSAISDYTVEYKKQISDAWSSTTVGGTGTSKTITSLSTGIRYMVRVKAENTQGLGFPSSVDEADAG